MRPNLTLCAALACAVFVAPVAQATDFRLLTDDASDKLRDSLHSASLVYDAKRNPDATLADILAAARADYARLIGVLYAAGFYSPVISIKVDGREAATIPPFERPASIQEVVVQIDAGQRFAFGQANVGPLAPDTEMPAEFATGLPAKSTLIEDAGRAAISGWREQGHAKAALGGQSVVADHAAATLDVDLLIDPARKLTFGDLIVDGKSRVRPDRIREIAGLPSGETFSPDEIDDAARRLRETGTFRSVSLTEAELAGADDSLDITASVVDNKRRRLGFGAEVSSQEGLTLSGYWIHRNLLGGAERLRFDAEVSGIAGDTGGVDYGLSTTFSRPATLTPDTTFGFTIDTFSNHEPDYTERTVNLEAILTHRYSDALQVSGGVGLRYSDVTDDLGSRSLTLATLPTTVTYDKRDNTLDPNRGYYLEGELTPFVDVFSGDTGGHFMADARGYYSFGTDDTVTLAGRFQIGSAFSAGVTEVPPEMLFFSGGGGTVRGQPYQSLGVDLPSGDTVGGRSFIGLSTEIRVDVTDDIGVVGFADAGFVGQTSLPGEQGDWHSGAGLGLRYNTGIGPVRFDVATPLGGATGNGIQFYIGIGQAF